MNKRDALIALATLASSALAPRAFAQSKREPVRVGLLHSSGRQSNSAVYEGFKTGMLALG
ncbi:MAG: hypothetical protein ACKVQK_28325 [Burkholderiales bacterium]